MNNLSMELMIEGWFDRFFVGENVSHFGGRFHPWGKTSPILGNDSIHDYRWKSGVFGSFAGLLMLNADLFEGITPDKLLKSILLEGWHGIRTGQTNRFRESESKIITKWHQQRQISTMQKASLYGKTWNLASLKPPDSWILETVASKTGRCIIICKNRVSVIR